jgi:hypothetical protein
MSTTAGNGIESLQPTLEAWIGDGGVDIYSTYVVIEILGMYYITQPEYVGREEAETCMFNLFASEFLFYTSYKNSMHCISLI